MKFEWLVNNKKRGSPRLLAHAAHLLRPALSLYLSLSTSSPLALLSDSPPKVSRESSGTEAQTPIPLY